MKFGNFGSKPMKTPKAPKVSGKKPFSSRTVIGVICIVLALLITFGVAPLVNRFTDQKVDIVRLKANVERGQIIEASDIEIVNVGSYIEETSMIIVLHFERLTMEAETAVDVLMLDEKQSEYLETLMSMDFYEMWAVLID